MRRKIAAGNWKMNGLPQAASVVEALAAAHPDPNCDVIICPPAPLVAGFAALDTGISIGGQDCHPELAGAHTGDTSAALLAACGATHVLVGHSERRADHGETDAVVRAKALAARAAGLVPIICVGETLAEREDRRTLEVVGSQIDGSVPEGAQPEDTIIAYEPVWAIGTGKVPGEADIAEVHGFIRNRLAGTFGPDAANGIRILYGGSVKAANAVSIFGLENVDGGLVGGASLTAEDFGPIIAAASGS